MYKNNFSKVYILLNLNKKYGGGFKFLEFLKYNLKKKKLLENNILKAKIILINSHHNFIKIVFYKFFFPKKIFIHRVDGPISLYTEKYDIRDYFVNLINRYVSDATIYQSLWSYKKNFKLNYNVNKIRKIIYNSADSRFFFNKKLKKKNKSIIISSFSSNDNKGFKYYRYLDQNLNFNKYSVTFVGNTNEKFKNIKIIKVQSSENLGNLLNKHSIYLTASKNDPCSNSLLEALQCKLPALVLNSGGHPELLKDRGYIFNNKKEMLNKIDILFDNYQKIKKKFNKNEIKTYFDYINFIEYINHLSDQKKLTVKYVSFFKLLYILTIFFIQKLFKIFNKNLILSNNI